MKLKYYLRGVGIGIIFATLVMTVSALVHKYNLSDEYIMREARKLGMVMKDELKVNDLFVNEETEETEDTEEQNDSTEAINSEETPDTPPENESESQSQTTPITPPESENQPESENPPVSEAPPVSETPVVPDTPVSSENDGNSETPTYVTITIVASDYARQVGQKLYEAGILSSAAEAEQFRKYMGAHGYDKSIKAGTYRIPIGSTYEEICKIVTHRA